MRLMKGTERRDSRHVDNTFDIKTSSYNGLGFITAVHVRLGLCGVRMPKLRRYSTRNQNIREYKYKRLSTLLLFSKYDLIWVHTKCRTEYTMSQLNFRIVYFRSLINAAEHISGLYSGGISSQLGKYCNDHIMERFNTYVRQLKCIMCTPCCLWANATRWI